MRFYSGYFTHPSDKILSAWVYVVAMDKIQWQVDTLFYFKILSGKISILFQCSSSASFYQVFFVWSSLSFGLVSFLLTFPLIQLLSPTYPYLCTNFWIHLFKCFQFKKPKAYKPLIASFWIFSHRYLRYWLYDISINILPFPSTLIFFNLVSNLPAINTSHFPYII